MQITAAPFAPIAPTRPASQPNEPLRAFMVFLGVVFCMAAFGLWLVPEAMASAEARVIRAGLTCLFVGAGFFLFRKGREEVEQLEQEVDLLHGEVRYILRGRDGVGRVAERVSFSELRFEPASQGRYSATRGSEVLFHLPQDVVQSSAFQRFLGNG